MIDRFIRCPHCRLPHDAAERVCPTTGLRIGADVVAQSVPKTRMSEHPPPSRKPEPLGFDARSAKPARPVPESRSSIISAASAEDIQRQLIGQTIGGRYRVVGILGEGGMGTVYDAEHLGLGRHVAIKVLSPSQAKKRVAVKRFQQEARAAGAIGHPNICEVYDLGSLDDGSPYLVMEKLVGQTLAERISREGGLPFDELVDVMIQVAGGLIAAHEKGIVHRDIKPENVFLARRTGLPPISKILDFGVSKMVQKVDDVEGERLDLTRTGMVMGTPYYMSPEQARGERNLDGRVDVYACGVMMYEALAGRRPFLAPNYNALLLAIINTSPKPLREVRPATPPDLEAIIVRAMVKNRDARIPTAMHLLRELQALPFGASAPPIRVPPPPTAEERKRAPVLGGQSRPAPVVKAPELSIKSAGATLRSRMSEPPPPDRETIIEGGKSRRGPTLVEEGSGSIEIPIEISNDSTSPGQEFVDDLPTAIFRPGKHPLPTELAPPSSVPDEWDGETIVRRPSDIIPLPSSLPTPRAPAPRDLRMINPDETVKIDEMEVDFDETRIAPPRRPR